MEVVENTYYHRSPPQISQQLFPDFSDVGNIVEESWQHVEKHVGPISENVDNCRENFGFDGKMSDFVGKRSEFSEIIEKE